MTSDSRNVDPNTMMNLRSFLNSLNRSEFNSILYAANVSLGTTSNKCYLKNIAAFFTPTAAKLSFTGR